MESGPASESARTRSKGSIDCFFRRRTDMNKDEEGIYKVETVPPPQGEDDAYSAPTRVGAL